MASHQWIALLWIGFGLYHLIAGWDDTDHEKTQTLVRFYGCLVLAGVWTTA